MLGRRFLIIVLVLMGLTALAASLAPRQPVVREDRAESTPTPAPAGTATSGIVAKELSTTGGSRRITVREGDIVELTVSGPERDAVMVLGRIDAIHPQAPARFSLRAGEPDEHPIELLGSGRRIGTLVISEG